MSTKAFEKLQRDTGFQPVIAMSESLDNDYEQCSRSTHRLEAIEARVTSSSQSGAFAACPRTSVASNNTFAADAAAILPANTSLAKLLASHILRDGEVVILVLRPSLWFIVLSSLRFLIGSLIAIIVIKYFGNHSMWSHGTVRSMLELVVSAISARLMWATLQWMSRLYMLTDLRVLSLSGVFNVSIFDCPLRKVARTRVIRSNEEKFTATGSIEIIPQDDSLPFGQWHMIAHPNAVHEQMVATINRAKQGGS